MSSLFTALGIDRLSAGERLQLITEIWDSLPESFRRRSSVIDASLITLPLAPSEPTLDELLQGITEANIPSVRDCNGW